MQTEIILPGRPYTKKNSQKIIVNKRTGRPMIIPSPQYRLYEEACLWRLKTYHGSRFEETLVNIQARYWMPDRRGWPDLSGLIQATADILEAAKVIDDDKYVFSWDGSHIAGIDKHNPRVEILISEIAKELWWEWMK